MPDMVNVGAKANASRSVAISVGCPTTLCADIICEAEVGFRITDHQDILRIALRKYRSDVRRVERGRRLVMFVVIGAQYQIEVVDDLELLNQLN